MKHAVPKIDDSSPLADVIDALDRVRSLLGMDMSYVSEAKPDCVEFQYVSGSSLPGIITPQHQLAYKDLYCAHILEGRLPSVIQDTHEISLARDLKFVREANVRSLISVPINRSNGDLYGMFCCFSHAPNPTLNARDGDIVRMFADLATKPMNVHLDALETKTTLVNQISDLITTDGIETFFQPIVSLSNGRTLAVEALSRFTKSAPQSPAWWFEQANNADLELDLELAAIKKAISYLPMLPDDIYMTLNASSETLTSRLLHDMIAHVPPSRLVLELTEHQKIKDFKALQDTIEIYADRGIGIAIDDLGAGYSGLNTVLRLNAHVLKLDRELVSNVHLDQAKQSLTKAMVHFANETNSFLIAEGVELIEEDNMLRQLGVRLGQGFLYGRPAPAHEAIANIARP